MKLSSLAPAKILLVDDNRDGLLVRRALLEELGYRVQIAVNGEEAFRLFQSTPYDVLVTDYRMPRMDGMELITRVRELEPHARIVLLSKLVEPLGLNEANTGADAVVAKSSSEPARLVRAVRRLLNRRPVRKPAARQSTRATPVRGARR